MGFEWRKDEEESWEEQVPVSVVVERPLPPYRLYAAVLIVLVAVVGIVYWQLRRRAEAAVAVMTGQVEASIGIWQQAILERDTELFDSLLSRQDREWVNDQQRLLREEQFWSRQLLGLQWQGTAVLTPTIILSPDLREAEVILPQRYGVRTQPGMTETVVLSQTALFRANDGRWLFSPPSEEFWGELEAIDGQYLSVTFPAHDRLIVEQVLTELEGIMDNACRLMTDEPCQSGLQVPVRFGTSTKGLVEQCFPVSYPKFCQIVLPSPTLVGLPQDDAGLQALTRGYAGMIVPSLLPTFSGWQGEQPLIYKAILAEELAQVGLSSFKLTPSQYESLLNPPVTLQELSLAWASTNFASLVTPEQMQALVAFLLARGETAVSWQRRPDTPNFWQWANLPANDPVAEADWLQFVYEQSASALRPPPVPLPDLEVRLICGGDKAYRYDGLAWRDEMLLYEGQSFVEAVPHDEGLIVTRHYYEEAVKDYLGRVFWVRGEQSIFFSEWHTRTDVPLLSAQQHDPAGRKLVLQAYDPVDRELVRYRLLDLDQCNEEDCSLLFLPGWPLWSADGRSTLIMETKLTSQVVPQQTQLWRGDADGQIVAKLGRGSAPFWLDQERYGYVRLGRSGRGEVVVATIHDDTPEVLLTLDELLGWLPDPNNPITAFMVDVRVNPSNPNHFLVRVIVPEFGEMFLFRVERQADQANRVTRLMAGSETVVAEFSPDGRWLLMDTTTAESGLHTITIATFSDIVQTALSIPGASQAVNYDWTADSQWLLINYPGFIKLIASAYDYQQIITHAFGSCERAEWVQ